MCCADFYSDCVRDCYRDTISHARAHSYSFGYACTDGNTHSYGDAGADRDRYGRTHRVGSSLAVTRPDADAGTHRERNAGVGHIATSRYSNTGAVDEYTRTTNEYTDGECDAVGITDVRRHTAGSRNRGASYGDAATHALDASDGHIDTERTRARQR